VHSGIILLARSQSGAVHLHLLSCSAIEEHRVSYAAVLAVVAAAAVVSTAVKCLISATEPVLVLY
jgi:hypothetical protein